MLVSMTATTDKMDTLDLAEETSKNDRTSQDVSISRKDTQHSNTLKAKHRKGEACSNQQVCSMLFVLDIC